MSAPIDWSGNFDGARTRGAAGASPMMPVSEDLPPWDSFGARGGTRLSPYDSDISLPPPVNSPPFYNSPRSPSLTPSRSGTLSATEDSGSQQRDGPFCELIGRVCKLSAYECKPGVAPFDDFDPVEFATCCRMAEICPDLNFSRIQLEEESSRQAEPRRGGDRADNRQVVNVYGDRANNGDIEDAPSAPASRTHVYRDDAGKLMFSTGSAEYPIEEEIVTWERESGLTMMVPNGTPFSIDKATIDARPDLQHIRCHYCVNGPNVGQKRSKWLVKCRRVACNVWYCQTHYPMYGNVAGLSRSHNDAATLKDMKTNKHSPFVCRACCGRCCCSPNNPLCKNPTEKRCDTFSQKSHKCEKVRHRVYNTTKRKQNKKKGDAQDDDEEEDEEDEDADKEDEEEEEEKPAGKKRGGKTSTASPTPPSRAPPGSTASGTRASKQASAAAATTGTPTASPTPPAAPLPAAASTSTPLPPPVIPPTAQQQSIPAPAVPPATAAPSGGAPSPAWDPEYGHPGIAPPHMGAPPMGAPAGARGVMHGMPAHAIYQAPAPPPRMMHPPPRGAGAPMYMPAQMHYGREYYEDDMSGASSSGRMHPGMAAPGYPPIVRVPQNPPMGQMAYYDEPYDDLNVGGGGGGAGAPQPPPRHDQGYYMAQQPRWNDPRAAPPVPPRYPPPRMDYGQPMPGGMMQPMPGHVMQPSMGPPPSMRGQGAYYNIPGRNM